MKISPRSTFVIAKYTLGESYAGHYIPAISHHIWEKNQEDNDEFKIPLKGLAIGNGLTNTEIQYTTYPDMALDGGTQIYLIFICLLYVDILMYFCLISILFPGKSEGGSLQEGVITNEFGKFCNVLMT